MQWPLSIAECLAQALVRRLIPIIPVDVLKTRGQFGKSIRIHAAVFLDTIAGARFQLVQIPASLGHADHRHIEATVPDHRLECGEDLLVGQITSRTKEDKRVRMRHRHGLRPPRIRPFALVIHRSISRVYAPLQ